MMFRHACLAALCLSLAAPASALSCRPAEPTAAFAEAAAADASFIVVQGRFAFEPALMPKTGAMPDGSVDVPARFKGKGLTQAGYTTPLTMPVTLDVRCAGPWCGGMTPDVPYLAFLERRGDGYHLNLDACPFYAFANPDAKTLDTVAACLAGGGCTSR